MNSALRRLVRGQIPAMTGMVLALRGRLGRSARNRVLAEFDLEDSAAELARRFGAEAVA